MQKYNTSYFYVLICAGIYNLVWGGWVILFPELSFTLHDMKVPTYPQIWQCVGMIVGVYGIGYIAAASDPIKHWPIILVGFLGKVFGPIGFIYSLYLEIFPISFMINILFNDLIWWIPFFMILKEAYATYIVEPNGLPLNHYNLSSKSVVVALRHQGCTFTRENLNNLNLYIPKIKQQGFDIYILHMSQNDEIEDTLNTFLKFDVNTISDPDRMLYKTLALSRASLFKAFGIKEFFRGFLGILKGYGLGPLRGDGFQLGGVFIIQNNMITHSFPTQRASDLYDFSWVENSETQR